MPQLIEPLVRPLVGQLIFSSSGSQAAPPPLADNYIGRWNFNSGVTSDGLRLVDDIATRGTVRPPQPGLCLDFNGTSQYVRSPTAFADPATWSAAAWIYPTAVNVQRAIFSNRTGGTWFIGVDNAHLFIWSGSASATGNVLTAATWQHVGYSYDGTNVRFYVNGVLSTTVPLSPPTLGTPAKIDIAYDNNVVSYYNARISEAYFAPGQVLTGANFASLYAHEFVTINSANGFFYKLDSPSSALMMDSSGNGNHGTITNWAAGMHYEGTDVPYSWQNEVGWSRNNGTNVATFGDDLSNAIWTKTQYTVSANASYSPSTNTLIADHLLEVAATAAHLSYNAVAVSSTSGTAPYLAVIDLRGISRSYAYLSIEDTTAAKYVKARVTLTGTGTIDTPTSATFKLAGMHIESLGAGWYRCYLACLPDSGHTTLRVRLDGLADDGTTASYLGVVTKGLAVSNAKLMIGAVYTPRKESAPTLDVLGNALQYTGQCPLQPVLGQANCATFNGSNQYANCGTGTWDTDGTQAMDVSFWVKTADTDGVMVGNVAGATAYTGWSIGLASSSLAIDWCSNAATSNRMLLFSAAGLVNDNTWHLVRVTYDGTKLAAGTVVYVDGIRQVMTTIVNGLTGSTTSAAPSLIGARGDIANYLFGSLCNINITIGSTTWHYPCSEGPGATQIHNTRADSGHGTLVNASAANWTTLQNVYHANQVLGHRTGVNLLKYSEQFDNAIWTNQGTPIVTANTYTAPDGTLTADTIEDSDAAGYEAKIQTVTCTNVDHTFSIYIRKTVGALTSYPGIEINASGNYVLINTTAGTYAVTSSAITASITSVDANWWRFVYTLTMTAGARTIQIWPALSSNGTSISSATVGTVVVWGAQLEVGSSATTYQRTIANPGTTRTPARYGSTLLSADGLTLTNPPGIYNDAAESTIDFTCGQPLATAWNGKTVPTAHLFGAATTDLRKRSVSAAQEDRYNILK